MKLPIVSNIKEQGMPGKMYLDLLKLEINTT